MMVSFQLEEHLDSIAGGENMKKIVFKLIQWADSQNKLEQLVTAACKSNPVKKELEIISEEMKR